MTTRGNVYTPELALGARQIKLLRLIGEEGACNSEEVLTGDYEPWFPEKGEPADFAKEVCWQLCTVREECLEYAVTAGERHGVYGGLAPKERRKLHGYRAPDDEEVALPAHGKASTYTNYRCRCDMCKAAWREYRAEKRRQRAS